MPKGKKIVHATLDPYATSTRTCRSIWPQVGDAGLTLDAVLGRGQETGSRASRATGSPR